MRHPKVPNDKTIIPLRLEPVGAQLCATCAGARWVYCDDPRRGVSRHWCPACTEPWHPCARRVACRDDSYNPTDRDECKANARLIAAAPAFWEAVTGDETPELWRISWLERLLSSFKETHDWQADEDPSATMEHFIEAEEMCRLLRAAIAAATPPEAAS